MAGDTLVLAIEGGAANWAPERWKRRFLETCSNRKVALLPHDACAPADVRFAAVWKPKPGVLAAFPNLRVIFNLGAGVDALIADPTLPDVPIVRVAVGDLTSRMTEYVVLHVLLHHRRLLELMDDQRHRRWQPKEQWAANALTVGVMGLGTLGLDAAQVLQRLGFNIAGWSARPKSVDGIACFSGKEGFEPFLRRTDILVCLLPLTPETKHILNRSVFERLNRNSPLGAPVLINAGRGGLQVEADILACLDDGTLGAATCDVFETEPLPANSPLWPHPKLVVTPHNAADTDPDAISAYVAQQIERFEAGKPLENVVDLTRGY